MKRSQQIREMIYRQWRLFGRMENFLIVEELKETLQESAQRVLQNKQISQRRRRQQLEALTLKASRADIAKWFRHFMMSFAASWGIDDQAEVIEDW